MVKKVLFFLLVIFIVIQFFRPTRNTGERNGPKSIENTYAVTGNVRAILEKACYNCHSNNTIYPWYYSIQPVAWWMNNHITGAKRKLNFSEFANYDLKRQDHKLEEVIESQTDKWMPLKSYTRGHREARLTDVERQEIIDWAKAVREDIAKKK